MNVRDGSALLYYLGIRRNGHASSSPPTLTITDWAQILRQAGENGIAPLLYRQLRALPPETVPPPAFDYLQEIAVRSAAQSLRIGLDLAEVLQAFRRHGIAVIVLKGGHLAQLVYESSALRTMCDLDIMVRRDDLTRAKDVLAEMGYAPQYFGVEQVDYAQHHHLRPMARPDGIRVEIHWTLARPAGPAEIDLDGIWERAQPVEIAGVQTLVLSPEDLILHLCLHTSFTHKFRVGLRMCWDLHEVVRHYRDAIDWEVVVRRAQQWGIGRYVYLTLQLVHELLAAEIPVKAIGSLRPPDFSARVVDWARTCIFSPESNASMSPSAARLWSLRRLELSVLLRTLWPSRLAMARIYGVPPDSARIYLYYPQRWLNLLRRYGRHAWNLWRGDHGVRDELRVVSEHVALDDWLYRTE